MKNFRYRINFILKNWKLVIHLLFSTYHFGVNNQLWCEFDSMFGKSFIRRFNPSQIWINYKMMEFRAVACYFVQEPQKLFPNHPRYKNRRT